MRRRSPTSAHLVLTLLLTAVAACSERPAPTSPGELTRPAFAANEGKVKIRVFRLGTNTLRLGGPAVTAEVNINNTGLAIPTGVSLRATIAQPQASREAANLSTQCSPGETETGKLPINACDMQFDVRASNQTTGVGELVAGAATLTLRVIQTANQVETELATKSIAVTLVGAPTIETLILAATTVAIDGPATSYIAGLQNPANTLQGVLLQGWIRQGLVRRAAGGTQLTCVSNPGVLPTGPCSMSSTVVVSNVGPGGTLIPGPATYELELIQSSGGANTILDTESVAITLVGNTPTIANLSLASTTIQIDGPGVDYKAFLQNFGPPVADWVLLQGEMHQEQEGVPLVFGAGGTLVSCGAGIGSLPTTGTGTCIVPFTVSAATQPFGPSPVAGPAKFVLKLYYAPPDETPVEFDEVIVDVTLTELAPAIVSVTPASSYVVLDMPGAMTSYTASIENPGPELPGAVLQGWIRQGLARRAATGQVITCGPTPGTLPNGGCTQAAVIIASSTAAGTGTLVPGPATFELELKQQDAGGSTILDTKTVPITLVANVTSIVSLTIASPTLTINGTRVGFTAVVYNPTGASLSSVFVQEYIDQGTVSKPAGGVSVSCGSGTGVLPTGACTVSFTVGASNASGGQALVPGPATFRIELRQGSTLLATKSIGVTLVN